MSESVLSLDSVQERLKAAPTSSRVAFKVQALYGLSYEGMRMPLSRSDSIDSGQICVTIDPEADSASNTGIVDFDQGELRVKYGAQMVFPGLHELVKAGRYHPSLLQPVRAVATDDCTLTGDNSGWHALGCLDFLPGSYLGWRRRRLRRPHRLQFGSLAFFAAGWDACRGGIRHPFPDQLAGASGWRSSSIWT